MRFISSEPDQTGIHGNMLIAILENGNIVATYALNRDTKSPETHYT